MGETSGLLAPVQVCEWIVLEVGNIRCGIAITQIQEINKQIDMTPVHHAPAYVRGVINLRGQIVTVVDLRVKFGLPPLALDEDRCIVVADAADILDPPANIRGVTGAFFSGIYPMEQGLVAFMHLPELLTYDAPARLS